MTIAMYDLEDNILFAFESYKECAEYFETSVDSIQCYISRSKKGQVDKKEDKKNHRWVKLYKIDEGDLDE